MFCGFLLENDPTCYYTRPMNLRAWRIKTGRSQEWLAKETGIDQTLISRYENGAKPRVPNARKIERATGGEVTVDDWYPESGSAS